MDLLKKDDILLANKYGVLPDPDFSVAKNEAVIAATIAKTNKRIEEKMKLWNESMRERAEATASFLKHVDAGRDNNVTRYFGRHELARLRGQDIITQLKGSVLSKNGQT